MQELEQHITSVCDELLINLEPPEKSKNNLDLIRDLQSDLNSLAKELNVSEDQIVRRIVQIKEDIVSLGNELEKDFSEVSSSKTPMSAVKELKQIS